MCRFNAHTIAYIGFMSSLDTPHDTDGMRREKQIIIINDLNENYHED